MDYEGIETMPEITSSPPITKLWIYTNYDCNLRCNYCLAESSPRAARRALTLESACRLVAEAVALGFEHVYYTGGEPLLLDEIYTMLAYASARLPATLLTNAMLLGGKRLERLIAIRNNNLTIQVSLDGSRPEHHDPYRGAGSWAKTLNGIRTLQEHGFRVRISTTETPANSVHLDEICEFRRSLGIGDADHIIRPLARRGFSQEGQEVSKQTLVPELTVNQDGVYWHPLATDPDLRVSERIFPLADAVQRVQEELRAFTGATEMKPFQ
jgi:MoaA/NifB/PqqE/SkfB family radical SAM enzyme